MLVEGIKSRPVYAPLTARPGGLHLLVANEEGGPALLDLLAAAPDGFADRAHVTYVPGGSAGAAHGTRLVAAGAASVREFATGPAALAHVRAALAAARMGTQVYVAGTEDFIGQVVEAALEAGVELGAIGAEHRGSLERRVQCVHCKAHHRARHDPARHLLGCGRALLVRDHYSRRIGAFQGVCIDAEEPGTAPPPEPVFA